MKTSEIGFIFSEHYHRDNVERETAIRRIGGDGENIVAKFYCERGHAEGAEWHWLTDNAIIIVTNALKKDGKLVCTKLIARPGQIVRYANSGLVNELDERTRKMRRWLAPKWLIAKAISHQRAGLNHT